MTCGPMRPAEQAPDATVCVIRFDHTVGPVLCWSTLDASETDAVRTAIESTLPMFVLPEGASSRRSNRPQASTPESLSNSTPNGRAFRLSIRHESRFVLPVGTTGEVLFGAAVFVLADDSSSATDQPLTSDVARRGASQFSVALLTKAPAMELLLNRLRSVVSVFVRAQYSESNGSSSTPGGRIDNGVSSAGQAVLRALHQSVLEGGLTADGVPDYGAQVPCAQLVCRRLRDHTWPLLQLLLLEGRVLLVSKSAARASAAAWGLASLLPGAIGAGLGHYRSATDAPRFRWKRFGLPLALFSDGDGADGRVNGSRAAAAPGNDSYHTSGNNSIEGSGTSSSSCSGGSTKRRGEFVCLAPLVPMADASRVFEHASYLAGTANQMVAAMPMAAPDVVFDLDTSVLLRTPQAPHAPPPPPLSTTNSSSSGGAISKDSPAAKSLRLAQQARRVAAVLDSGSSGSIYSSSSHNSNSSSASSNFGSSAAGGSAIKNNSSSNSSGSSIVGDSVASSFGSLLAVLDDIRGPRDRAHYLACQARAGGASGADGGFLGGWLASAQAAHAATLVARDEGSSSAAAAAAAVGLSHYGSSSTRSRAGAGEDQSDSCAEDEDANDGGGSSSGGVRGDGDVGSNNNTRRTTGGWVGSDAWVHGQVQAIFEMLLEKTDEVLLLHGASNNNDGSGSSSMSSSSGNSSSEGQNSSSSGFGWGGKLLAVAASRGVVLPSSLLGALPGGPVAAALAPLAGAEFIALWLDTCHFSAWREGHVARMASRKRQQAARAKNGQMATGTTRGESRSSVGESAGSSSKSTITSSGSGMGGFLSNNLLAAGTLRLLGNSVPGNGSGNDGTEGNAEESSSSLAPPREGDALSFTFPNGDRYKGGWSEGLRHGEGLVLLARGGKYEGQWQGDVWHGEGVFTSSSEDFIYDGEWQFGHRTGRGHAIWAGRQESYTGEWLKGDFHGRGVHCSGAGDVYDGEFRYGLKCGVGTLVKATAPHSSTRASSLPSSSSASRNSGHNHPRSSGFLPPRMWRPDSGVYVTLASRGLGNVSNEGAAGRNSTETESSVALGGDDGCSSGGGWWRYTGEWCDGFREGTGTLHLMDGSSYSGEFKFDWPSGEGTWVLQCGINGSKSGNESGGSDGKDVSKGSRRKDDQSQDRTGTSCDSTSGAAPAQAAGEAWQVCYEGEWLVGLRHGEGLEAMPIAIPTSILSSPSALYKPTEGSNDGEGSVINAPMQLVPGAVFTREGPFSRGAALAGDHWRLTWSGLDSATLKGGEKGGGSRGGTIREAGSGSGRGAAAASASSMRHQHHHSTPSVFGGYGHADEAGGVGLGASGSLLGSDRTYLGAATSDGVPHGTGTMKWTLLGAVYSGQWREGQRHGQGVCVYRDGSYHKGEWREDRPLDPNLTMEDIDLNTAGTCSWLEPGVTANWALGDDSKPVNPQTTLSGNRAATNTSQNINGSSNSGSIDGSSNGGLGIENGLLHLLAAPAAAWVSSGGGSSSGSDSIMAPLEQSLRGAGGKGVSSGPYTSSNGRVLGRWHERDFEQTSAATSDQSSNPIDRGRWQLKQGLGLLLRGDWSNLTLIDRNHTPVAEESRLSSVEVAVVLEASPAGGTAGTEAGGESAAAATAPVAADPGQVTGTGAGEDALAGVSYAGAWRHGLPHGKGKLTKHSIVAVTSAAAAPAAAMSADFTSQSGNRSDGDLEAIDLLNASSSDTTANTSVGSSAENDSGRCAVEWEYEGEFVGGRMHGVGTFRWKPINKPTSTATATNGTDSNADVAEGGLLGLAASGGATCDSPSKINKAPSPAAAAAAAAAATAAAASTALNAQSPESGQSFSTSSAEIAARLESLSHFSLLGQVPWDDNSIITVVAKNSDGNHQRHSSSSSSSSSNSNIGIEESEEEEEAAWATVWRGMEVRVGPGGGSSSSGVGAWVELSGEWIEGAPCGVATATYASGAEYSGSWAPQGFGGRHDLQHVCGRISSKISGDSVASETNSSEVAEEGATAVAAISAGEAARLHVGVGASALRWVAAQAIAGASRSLPEGEGTWHSHAWPLSSIPVSVHNRRQDSSSSSSKNSSHDDGSYNNNEKCSVVFRGQWVGGAAHGDGVWIVTYPYSDRRISTQPRARGVTGGGGRGDGEERVQWRCEEREGRWRRGFPVAGGDWRVQWSELQDAKEALTASNDHSVHARHRALGRSGQYVGCLGSDGRPGNGEGVCKYPGGGLYTGLWLQGKRHGGQGCFVWPDGACFEGNWANDKAACQQVLEGEEEGSNSGSSATGSGVLRMPDGREHAFGNEPSDFM